MGLLWLITGLIAVAICDEGCTRRGSQNSSEAADFAQVRPPKPNSTNWNFRGWERYDRDLATLQDRAQIVLELQNWETIRVLRCKLRKPFPRPQFPLALLGEYVRGRVRLRFVVVYIPPTRPYPPAPALVLLHRQTVTQSSISFKRSRLKGSSA